MKTQTNALKGENEMDDEKKQTEIPWLEKIDKAEPSEKTEIEKIDYITMLEELEFK